MKFTILSLAFVFNLLNSSSSTERIGVKGQFILPLSKISPELAGSFTSSSITGFDIDSQGLIYLSYNTPKSKGTYTAKLKQGNVLFNKQSSFLSRKLFIINNFLVTGSENKKNLLMHFFDKSTGLFIKNLVIKSSHVINNFYFEKDQIAIEYYSQGGAEAKYELYSYNGESIINSKYSRGYKSFIENHLAEGAFWIGDNLDKVYYAGSDLDNKVDKIWVASDKGGILDSASIKPSTLGAPLMDLEEFSKIKNGNVWLLRYKGKNLIFTTINQ